MSGFPFVDADPGVIRDMHTSALHENFHFDAMLSSGKVRLPYTHDDWLIAGIVQKPDAFEIVPE